MTLHPLRPGQHPYNDGPPLDYALYSTPEECDRIQRIVEQIRKEAWQFRVKISCIALAGLIVCGIVAQFSRGWF